MPITTQAFHIQGRVQGVGFRPFIVKLCHKCDLSGWVRNQVNGVVAQVEGEKSKIDEFLGLIISESPPASQITSILPVEVDITDRPQGVHIRYSQDSGEQITSVSPDLCLCEECRSELLGESRRHNHAFINCTNCGPRYSIIRSLPYDRINTTMSEFQLCPDCQREYEDFCDRRFHAEPNACLSCGPSYKFKTKNGQEFVGSKMVERVSEELKQGGVLAIKGLSGFHLSCSALDELAVSRLRILKHRDQNPFAVMFRDLEQLQSYVKLSPAELSVLTGPESPIVLLENIPHRLLVHSVNPGLSRIAVMLPYTPLQVLIMQQPEMPPLVMTSANESRNPVIFEDAIAWQQFGNICDGVVLSDRSIHNRCDDSVVMIVGEKTALIRRARGYVPDPIDMTQSVEGIFAVGAELKNTFCLGRDHLAILGPHIGDLKTPSSLSFFEEVRAKFANLYRFEAKWVVHDLHPDYESTRIAQNSGLPCIGVQHHHAHIASVMAEHSIEGSVIGIALDGIGYGGDGTLWGGEWFECDLLSYTRKGHLPYLALPGGDQATKEPWRLVVSAFHENGCDIDQLASILVDIPVDSIESIVALLRSSIPKVKSCSAGRWFDAISAMIGKCVHQEYEGQAPMMLEQSINDFSVSFDPYPYIKGETPGFKPMLDAIILDLHLNMPQGIMSRRFHDTIVSIILDWALYSKVASGLDRIVLSGGVFQNRYLLVRSIECLRAKGFNVFCSERVPCNDGGISLGQLAIAAARLSLEV